MRARINPPARRCVGAGLLRARAATQGTVIQSIKLPTSARDWVLLGREHRAAQRMAEAITAFAEAERLAPADSVIGFGHAQLRYECGLASAERFAALAQGAPANLMITAAHATALAAEGEPARAEDLLSAALAIHPEWTDGHKVLASLRWTSGAAPDRFADHYAAACAAQPDNRALRLAWFHTMALIKDWAAAQRIIADGEAATGTHAAYTLAKLFIASESGDDARAEKLFTQTSTLSDPGLELCRIRYGVRVGRYAEAEAAALRLLQTPYAANAWPYLSLIWRLRGNARAEWLDAPASTIKHYDLDFTEAEIAELATLLRSLHTTRAPYLDQSVRGGTQTNQPLFFRQEPIIQAAKAKIEAAVSTYVNTLPTLDRDHPLSAAPREVIRFAGSWSVRLKPGGFHVAHTHPMGAISSSFYVALPTPEQRGAPRAGWISFGTPPPELGHSLDHYTQIEPKVGRLVLFPSTMWHATEPFTDGERLVIAFDVARAAT